MDVHSILKAVFFLEIASTAFVCSARRVSRKLSVSLIGGFAALVPAFTATNEFLGAGSSRTKSLTRRYVPRT